LRIEALLRHQWGGAVRRALAFAANAKDIDVVAHKIGQIDRHRLRRERREADPPATIDHACRLIQRIGRARAFEHILHALPLGQALHRFHRIFAADIDDRVGAELFPHLEASVAGAGQDDGLGAQSLGYADAHEPYRPWTNDGNPLASDDAAHDIQPVHRRPGGDDERCFRVAHLVRDMSEGIYVVDSIFGKAAIGAEAVGAVPLRAIAVIQARGIHTLTAALTAAAPGMHLDRDALADLKLIHGRAELDNRTHIFVAWRKAAIKWQLAIDHRRHAVADDLAVGCADRDRIDP